MEVTYQKFLKQNINLENVGVIFRTDNESYFCTPRGASIIGWAGVDGIHYCKIRGFGEMIFAVSPMNGVGEYVHPLAESFEDFLRLLLACGDVAALEQTWQWDASGFEKFLKDNPLTERQSVVLAEIADKLHLTPMEDAWQYISSLQNSFDYSRIKFTEDYYDIDMNANAPTSMPQWKVYFEHGFRNAGKKGRAGKEIAVGKQFVWAGHEWLVPAIYSCGKGLVVDFCMRVEAEEFQDFMDKWDLDVENEADKQFSKEEQMLIDLDNPYCINFNPWIVLNGKELRSSRGTGMTYYPLAPEGHNAELNLVMEHYGLDETAGWLLWRSYFPWNTVRKPQMKTFEIVMKQQKAAIPGPHFRVDGAGDTVNLTHPVSGKEYTLTVQEYSKQEMDFGRVPNQDFEYPTHCYQMVYTTTPEMESGTMTIMDCAEGDRPRQKKHDPYHPVAVASIGIIGGADGPTAIIYGNSSEQGRLSVACSSLHFEPVEDVEWRMVFHEKQYEDEIFRLI